MSYASTCITFYAKNDVNLDSDGQLNGRIHYETYITLQIPVME